MLGVCYKGWIGGIHIACSVCCCDVCVCYSFSCAKLLKSSAEAQAHATRTGHSNFAESTEQIKPLTEEEKKAKVAE